MCAGTSHMCFENEDEQHRDAERCGSAESGQLLWATFLVAVGLLVARPSAWRRSCRSKGGDRGVVVRRLRPLDPLASRRRRGARGNRIGRRLPRGRRRARHDISSAGATSSVAADDGRWINSAAYIARSPSTAHRKLPTFNGPPLGRLCWPHSEARRLRPREPAYPPPPSPRRRSRPTRRTGLLSAVRSDRRGRS